MDWKYIILTGTTIIFFTVGLMGIALPFLPGIPLIWLGIVIYGAFTSFARLSFLIIVVFTVLMLFTVIVDYLANLYGAKKFGAGKLGIFFAIIGMMTGVVAAGLVGLIIGPLIGAIIGELLSGKSHRQALRAGLGTIVGFLGGTIIKFIIGLVMIGIFIWQVF
ncbi:MAG: DUF456 domain-containing protein [Candidatus Kerfeldbacteria bacterium CG08_land_8_20_14_0_20_40_16]|uniref:DUF456 domain-containing protein n=1 Tax=Candidatus Kerfeldbacteria bacterium CG08_land_8_20_14_0_20_40_16 TaxID=2014244 RepID=A0A2H0YWM4_9BACT|nr:MAG: DUF456 domain-containing protein [Candidatus Kerfeldbacteria bacterium CG08_land_8_20_14_0_20_40_16]